MEGLVNFARVGYAAPVYVFSYRQTAESGVAEVQVALGWLIVGKDNLPADSCSIRWRRTYQNSSANAVTHYVTDFRISLQISSFGGHVTLLRFLDRPISCSKVYEVVGSGDSGYNTSIRIRSRGIAGKHRFSKRNSFYHPVDVYAPSVEEWFDTILYVVGIRVEPFDPRGLAGRSFWYRDWASLGADTGNVDRDVAR